RVASEFGGPQRFERGIVKQPEPELFLEERLWCGRHHDALVTRRVEHELLFGDVEQIEQLEEAIQNIDRASAERRVDDEGFLGEDELLRSHGYGVGEILLAQRAGQPLHLAAIVI